MFGKETKTSKQKALEYFETQVQYMNGNGALAWLRGGLELAQEIGLLTENEVEKIDSKGKAKYEANQKAIKEEKERIAAERKAAKNKT